MWLRLNKCAAQASPGDAAAAAAMSATAAQLRQWVDTATSKDHLLLHARVEAAAGRCARGCLSSGLAGMV
jgi:hypothetical protein